MADQVGNYVIKVNGAAAKFWPLVPGTTVHDAKGTFVNPVAPGGPAQPLTIPSPFGIFDISIQLSQDELVKTAIAEEALPAAITPIPTVARMPLVLDASGNLRICFAVPVPATTAGPFFSGLLHLEAMQGTAAPGVARRMEIPLKIGPDAAAANLAIFFLPHKAPPLSYVWVKLQAVDAASPATGVGLAHGTCKVLRDNQTFRSINRTFAVETDAAGFVCAEGSDRNVLGLPLGWPLILQLAREGFVDRAHMLKFAPADVKDNLAPLVSTPPHERLQARMSRTSDASLATRKVLLDAGHGVVYAYAPARRSQEWYVAHKVCDRVAELLAAPPFDMPPENIFRTRTAGFGLIRPEDIGLTAAPDAAAANASPRGENLYLMELDPQNTGTCEPRIRARINSVALKDISDLLLTRHDPETLARLPVPDAERATVLSASATTLAAIQARLDQKLGPSKRVQPGSIRWDAAKADYVYRPEPVPPAVSPSEAPLERLPISTSDWFSLDASHLEVLAERSALWSIASELGGDPPFQHAVRATMKASGALAYMKAAILADLDVDDPPRPEWLQHGIKAWGPEARCAYFNATSCDLYLSVHENAGGAIGGYALVSRSGNPGDAAPPAQIQLAKVFVKYVDPFDQGVCKSGIGFEEAGNPVYMLHHSNHIRDRYYYAETEYMDRLVPGTPGRYQIQEMIDGDYIETLAKQLVESIAEALLGRQSSMDTITCTQAELPLW